ncbi:hypothetical protein THIOKS1680027 [Thiocapsa sp. KS1]|nr:hypothetical protein THIOKS1680027 [Thiocapsa sp. KS1]
MMQIVACRRAKAVGTLPPKFSGLHTFKGGFTRCLAPRLLSCLRIRRAVASLTERLDTGLAAHDYPDGIPTRSKKTRHCRAALAPSLVIKNQDESDWKAT